MDIQQVASQLINYLGKNPELITQFIEHPYSTTAKATGSDAEISKRDMSQIVTAAAALANGQQLGMGDVANIASALMGQNNNSVHSLTSMLFGGGNTQQATASAQAQTKPNGSLDLGSLVSMGLIAATLLSSAKKRKEQAAAQQAAAEAAAQQLAAQQAAQAAAQQQAQAVKPNQGLDLGTIASLAGQFLGAGNAAQQQPQVVLPQATQAQQQPAGIDFGTIAQLASILMQK